MSLTHAILTSLLERPCTGAELARRFDKSLGYFWQATHQQIYRELGKMEESGLVEARGLPSSRGQQRHFEVLDPGRAELLRWCGGHGEPRPVRDELMVRLRAAAVLGTVDVRDELRRHRVLHAETLGSYEAIEAQDFPPNAPRSVADELQLAVLRAGVAFEKSWLTWCDQTLANLKK
ncbi:DNA-binding transcriptional regulator, PadR family [Arthrobacter alpinus]|uniref:DNA-binding transcriptional regulator, PadR family n=1 Tax=Arthrobacter alpinus TaxID=656366 RepID=A0A1H5JY77_9MICC|nr:DNA-binding transcriptional regulator, PadR family [Arthrobacter alpinus]